MTSTIVHGQNANYVRLYGLANPSHFVAERAALGRFVFDAVQVAPSERHSVEISEGNGWLTYKAKGEIWDRRSAPALPDRDTAQRTAEKLLTRLQETCSDSNKQWPKRLRGMSLLPPLGLLRPAELVCVARRDGDGFDHWLYRAEPRLQLDEAGEVRSGVLGAQIEVRIGHGGKPVGIHSRWRPLSDERKLTDLSPYVAPPMAEEDHDHGNEGSTPSLMFLLEGSGVPQYYLAPYYASSDHSGVQLVSASPFSLTAHIARTDQKDRRMTVSAFARGGSGDYAYNWACYSLTSFEEGLREIGPGRQFQLETQLGKVSASSVDLELGAYVVLLNIKDRQTGAFKHAQRQIFSAMVGESEVG